MAIYRGFVRSIQVRDDGWVEFVLQAVHAGNTSEIFFIADLDGDIDDAHRRLAHLSLLRDALARILPVEVQYRDDDAQGQLVDQVVIYPRPSIDGRDGARRVEGTVIGMTLAERGPESGVTPYIDEADLAVITVLIEDGSIEQVILDLQRPDVMTAQAMLGLISEAHRTRRPVSLLINWESDYGKTQPHTGVAGESTGSSSPGYILACEWVTVPEEMLDYDYAFIERLNQRYESYDDMDVKAFTHIRVLYRTSPGQTPEGDISDNGSFIPQSKELWVHGNSPLLERLEVALRERFQVKLGYIDEFLHEVELIGHLGSAAQPIWIKVKKRVLPVAESEVGCNNIPTVQSPTAVDLSDYPQTISWGGQAYFNEGIWRFVISGDASYKLIIDGELPCCSSGEESGIDKPISVERSFEVHTANFERGQRSMNCHAYLNGLHNVELVIGGHKCAQPFRLLSYRIR